MKDKISENENSENKKLLYSIQELADLLGCSQVTAQKIKNSGQIPYFQVGKKLIFDVEKVMKALERGLK